MVQTHEQLGATGYYIGKNVEVSPNVVIAAGAVLDAAPGSRLVIEADVCIGSGVVIQVYGGDLTLGAGVNLGKEVLLVGCGAIAPRACIGAESTVMNPQIEADAVIPARSLIGDRGQPLPSPASTTDTNGAQASPKPESASENTSQNGQSPEAPPPVATDNNSSKAEENGASEKSSEAAEVSTLTAANMVYGRDQVMQLVKTLFPHRDMLNGNQNGSDDSS
jgi:carbon dioxide concentrating mechanism protein CcmN